MHIAETNASGYYRLRRGGSHSVRGRVAMTRKISAFSSWRGDLCVLRRRGALDYVRLTGGLGVRYSGGMQKKWFEFPILYSGLNFLYSTLV